MACFSDLPEEVVLEITDYLTYLDLEACAATSKLLKLLTFDDVEGVRDKYRKVETADYDKEHMTACDFLAETQGKVLAR